MEGFERIEVSRGWSGGDFVGRQDAVVEVLHAEWKADRRP
jgi:hypothetical protein